MTTLGMKTLSMITISVKPPYMKNMKNCRYEYENCRYDNSKYEKY